MIIKPVAEHIIVWPRHTKDTASFKEASFYADLILKIQAVISGRIKEREGK